VATKRLSKRMPRKDSLCFSPQTLPASKSKEMDRQWKGQEQGLNDMSVEEYLEARKALDPKNRDQKAAKAARASFKQKTQAKTFKELRSSGSSLEEAERLAQEHADSTMETMNALHNPDLVAGGKNKIADSGDGEVNQTIGRQWSHKKRGQTTRIQDLDDAASRVPVGKRKGTKINGRLERCK